MNKNNKALLLGMLSALFFAVTFVLNRLMSMEGGNWIWSSSLRFYWMLPVFFAIVIYRRGLSSLLAEIKKQPLQWILWSTVGFGLFYAPLTYAAAFSPSWLVASTWQITIIAGMIVAPWINKGIRTKPSAKTFLFSAIILLGIFIMQVNALKTTSFESIFSGFFWIVLAAFAYPLGNRKMMQVTNGKLDVYQRILGMIVCSLPFWFILNIYAIHVDQSAPTAAQYIQTGIVAIFSGVIATVLFFSATEMVKKNEQVLAKVEATQSAEVPFALLGEVWLLQHLSIDIYAAIGIALVVTGMILHSIKS